MSKCRTVEDDETDLWFPNEVVKANVRGDSLIKTWRNHLGLAQRELAQKADMKQSSLARIEGADPSTIREPAHCG
jgi:ribosome-binding protein aMBF1 (putative translation factor)